MLGLKDYAIIPGFVLFNAKLKYSLCISITVLYVRTLCKNLFVYEACCLIFRRLMDFVSFSQLFCAPVVLNGVCQSLLGVSVLSLGAWFWPFTASNPAPFQVPPLLPGSLALPGSHGSLSLETTP